MIKERNFFCKHADCQECKEETKGGFKYIETHKGEIYNFEMKDTFTLVFLIKGKALISCNEFINMPIKGNEMALWPKNAKCSWTSLTDTISITLEGTNEMAACDRIALRENANRWLNAIPTFQTLVIRKSLAYFLSSVRKYLEDGITCPYMHKSKQLELSTIFRAYYLPEELMNFFLPTVCNTHEFETFIMNNYLQMKGVKEFVDLSGMNLGTFKRKFKTHFKMSPYQWLIKQKSKHIYYEISSSDKSFTMIAKDFKFTDASHFNRYCKTMFGSAPSEIRKSFLNKV